MKQLIIIYKNFDLLEGLTMVQEFYTLLNFNLVMIYIIHKMSVMLKIIQTTLRIVF